MAYHTNRTKIHAGIITIYQINTTTIKTWYYRFKDPTGETNYIRKSTGSIDFGIASHIAITAYEKLKARSFYGAETNTTTFQYLFDKFNEELPEGGVKSAENARKHFLKFFKNNDLYSITDSNIRKYFIFRTSDHSLGDRKYINGIRPKRTVAVSTLEKERKYLKFFIRRGFENNLIKKMPSFRFDLRRLPNVITKPENARRGRLTDEQYNILLNHHRSFKKEWNRALIEPREKHSFIFRHRQHRYDSVVFYFITQLILQTGMRAQEASGLYFGDFKLRNDIYEKNMFFTEIRITAENSKVKRHRDIIASDMERTYERLEQYKTEWMLFYGRAPTDLDLVFPDKRNIQNKRTFHSLIRKKFTKLGIRVVENPDGIDTHNTLYSLRSKYISKQISEGIDVYSISKVCGVQVDTLARYYDINLNWAFRKQLCAQLIRIRNNEKPTT